MNMELRELLSKRPFVPFTVVMSDGTHITIKHPEMAMLTKLFLYVATSDGERANHLYLLDITRIETQEQAA